jgi:hypothetical protein
MARTALTIVDSARAGTVLPAGTAADVANGNVITNTGNILILAKNTNAASTTRNVTIAVTGRIDGLPVTARTIPIAPGVTQVLGPYDTTNYGSALAINGDHAEVTFQVIRPGIA